MKMEIKTGDSVRVKPGVKDPDYEYDISGWQGRVTHIDTDEGKFIEIAWDSITLDQMPVELIETSIEEGFDYYLMWLNENEVDLTEPRDKQQAVDERINALNEQFGYISPDEQSKNIAQILDSKDLSVSEENLDKFFDYLSEHIEYPCLLTGAEDFSWEEPYLFGVFDQEEYERLKKKRASYTNHFKLVKLEDIIDDLRGILVKVKRIGDKKVFVLPLWDLKTVDRKDKNHQLIEDYSFWMSNYR
jgi:hypothetical protein